MRTESNRCDLISYDTLKTEFSTPLKDVTHTKSGEDSAINCQMFIRWYLGDVDICLWINICTLPSKYKVGFDLHGRYPLSYVYYIFYNLYYKGELDG